MSKRRSWLLKCLLATFCTCVVLLPLALFYIRSATPQVASISLSDVDDDDRSEIVFESPLLEIWIDNTPNPEKSSLRWWRKATCSGGGARIIRWYIKSLGLDLARWTFRNILFDWLVNETWPGELWDAEYGWTIVYGFGEIVRVRLTAKLKLVPLEVTKVYTMWADKYYIRVDYYIRNLSNETFVIKARDSLDPGFAIEWAGYVYKPRYNFYAFRVDNATRDDGKFVGNVKLFLYRDNQTAYRGRVIWAGIYGPTSMEGGSYVFGGFSVPEEFQSKTYSLWREMGIGWTKVQVAFKHEELAPGESVHYALNVYGGPMDASLLQEAGFYGFDEEFIRECQKPVEDWLAKMRTILSNPKPIYIMFVMHCHQPDYSSLNFSKWGGMEAVSYEGMVSVLEQNPDIGFTFDLSGSLLIQLHECGYDDLIERFKALYDRGQIEIVTTPMYHPICPFWPSRDIREQIKMGKETFKRFFGRYPRGMWLPEMAYSPWLADGESLIKVFAPEGIEFTFVDESLWWDSWNALSDEKKNLYMPVWSRYNWRPWRPVRAIDWEGNSMVFFIRDGWCSGRISFIYAGIGAGNAPYYCCADDFFDFLEELEEYYYHINDGRIGIVFAMDGETVGYWWKDAIPWLNETLRKIKERAPYAKVVTVTYYLDEVLKGSLDTVELWASGTWGDRCGTPDPFFIWRGTYTDQFLLTRINCAREEVQRAQELVDKAKAEGVDTSEAEKYMVMAWNRTYDAECSDWEFYHWDNALRSRGIAHAIAAEKYAMEAVKALWRAGYRTPEVEEYLAPTRQLVAKWEYATPDPNPDLVIRNPYYRIVVDVAHGGQIIEWDNYEECRDLVNTCEMVNYESWYFMWDGFTMTNPVTVRGVLLDGLYEEEEAVGWIHQEFMYGQYSCSILENSSDVFKVRLVHTTEDYLTGEKGAVRNPVAGIQITKELTFKADTPYVEAKITLTNVGSSSKSVTYVCENAFTPGGEYFGNDFLWIIYPNGTEVKKSIAPPAPPVGMAFAKTYVKPIGSIKEYDPSGEVVLFDSYMKDGAKISVLRGSLKSIELDLRIPQPSGRYANDLRGSGYWGACVRLVFDTVRLNPGSSISYAVVVGAGKWSQIGISPPA